MFGNKEWREEYVSQLSCHRLTLWSLPMTHLEFSITMLAMLLTRFQMHDPPWTESMDRWRPLLIYLARNQMAHKELPKRARLPNLTKQALLSWLTLQIPKSPSDFRRQTFFQLTKLALCLASEADQRKSLMCLSMAAQMLLRRGGD